MCSYDLITGNRTCFLLLGHNFTIIVIYVNYFKVMQNYDYLKRYNNISITNTIAVDLKVAFNIMAYALF